ncbi:helix-turn-helix domain-containing protein [Paeniglutamicibacter sp. NPDC091659]|uniref:helix-turn-helix domain-containing protein n=1 Tax=Paeniglutamicibacter sp. NPDC091659 TaxID=3364389 RepID=UPI003819A702
MSEQRITAAEYDQLPELVNAEEVARMLDSNAVQVTRWAADGVIPGRKIGRTWFFSKSALEALVKQPASAAQTSKSSVLTDDTQDAPALIEE